MATHDLPADMTVLELIQTGEAHGLAPTEAFNAWWTHNYRVARESTSTTAECDDVSCRAQMILDDAATRARTEDDV